ncbi:MAG: type II toxin-antitoxin system RelE/ParE family toxin [Luteolibacter sp.]
MVIHFRNAKLEKTFASEKQLTRTYGPDQAKTLVLRISQLRSARCLADLLLIPPLRAHELGADRKGQISLHLRQPYRLILVPAHDPPPAKPDGGLDWQSVTEVTIIEVVDYH